ncbi:mas-related G-protein coupled receptor member X2-like [Octodon degus]|uniref:Mas-related G-protein coupled receptor member X2-like n=1 Tax=Octodon degus TaxID=10160 RepID=A0A6P3VBF5_OCTDE|nr:mas-related G-protein coupled receptor member X2-like [Octodon degus]
MEERGLGGDFATMDPVTPDGSVEYPTMDTYIPADPPPVSSEFLIPDWLNFTIALIGLAGNIVVLWFLRDRTQRNSISVYVINLAVADFLFLCTFIILYVVVFTGQVNPVHYVYFHVMRLFSYITGVSMISAISSECCLSVLFPNWYHSHRPRHTSSVTSSVLWVVAFLLVILTYTLCITLFYTADDICRIMHFITAAWLIFLFVVLSGSSLVLLIRILCGSGRLLITRLHVTLGLRVLVFFLCGLLLGILWIKSGTNSYISNSLWSIAGFLSIINSSVNLIIYFSVGSFRHKSLWLSVHKALEDVTEE